MQDTLQAELRARYMAAVDSFVAKVKEDRNVLAVIVSGSLAYDVLWEKSDVDMSVVVRDQLLKNDSYSLMEDDVLINVHLTTRSEFRRGLEGSYGGSFFQSFIAKGQVVYCTDESFAQFIEDAREIGQDDMARSALINAAELISLREKAEKWLTARKDPLYAQYYLLKCAEPVARMEVCLAGKPMGRDVIQKGLELNPEILHPIYTQAMARYLSEEEIWAGIRLLDDYLEQHLPIYSKPVLEFMGDEELKTGTLIAKHFGMASHFIIHAFEYLADKGLIERASQLIRITPKGRQIHEELGFIYIP